MKLKDLVEELEATQGGELLCEGFTDDIINTIKTSFSKYADQTVATKMISNAETFMGKINLAFKSLKGEARTSFMKTLNRMGGSKTYSDAIENMSDLKAALTYFVGKETIAELETLLSPIQKIRIA